MGRTDSNVNPVAPERNGFVRSVTTALSAGLQRLGSHKVQQQEPANSTDKWHMRTDWEQVWHPKEKMFYFQDRRTGEVSWTKPDDFDGDLKKAPKLGNLSEKQKLSAIPFISSINMPPGWERAYDEKHKKWYYYNQETKERSWYKPTCEPQQPQPRESRVDNTVTKSHDTRSHSTPLHSHGSPAPWRNVQEPHVNWDSFDFKRRLEEAQTMNDKTLFHTVLAEIVRSNFALLSTWRRTLQVPKTDLVLFKEATNVLTAESHQRENRPSILYSVKPLCATMYEAACKWKGSIVCAIVSSNGLEAGGNYTDGYEGEEEDICRRCSNLYPSLKQAERDKYYPYGPESFSSETNRHFADVLYTPGVQIVRGTQIDGYPVMPQENRAEACLISAVDPGPRQVEDMKDESWSTQVREAAKAILVAPLLKKPETSILVIGNWGAKLPEFSLEDRLELFADLLFGPATHQQERSSEVTGTKPDIEIGSFYQQIVFSLELCSRSEPDAQNARLCLQNELQGAKGGQALLEEISHAETLTESQQQRLINIKENEAVRIFRRVIASREGRTQAITPL